MRVMEKYDSHLPFGPQGRFPPLCKTSHLPPKRPRITAIFPSCERTAKLDPNRPRCPLFYKFRIYPPSLLCQRRPYGSPHEMGRKTIVMAGGLRWRTQKARRLTFKPRRAFAVILNFPFTVLKTHFPGCPLSKGQPSCHMAWGIYL